MVWPEAGDKAKPREWRLPGNEWGRAWHPSVSSPRLAPGLLWTEQGPGRLELRKAQCKGERVMKVVSRCKLKRTSLLHIEMDSWH